MDTQEMGIFGKSEDTHLHIPAMDRMVRTEQRWERKKDISLQIKNIPEKELWRRSWG